MLLRSSGEFLQITLMTHHSTLYVSSTVIDHGSLLTFWRFTNRIIIIIIIIIIIDVTYDSHFSFKPHSL